MPKPTPYVQLSTLAGYRVMQQEGSLLRLRNDDHGKEAVVALACKVGTRICSVGPDCPESGRWFARASRNGVSYVASWLSPSAARRRFKAELA